MPISKTSLDLPTSRDHDASASDQKDFGRICRCMVGAIAGYAGAVAIVMNILLRVLPNTEGFVHTQVTPLYVAMCVHAVVAASSLVGLLLLRQRRVVRPMQPRLLMVAVTVFAPISLDLVVGAFYPLPDEKTSVLQPHKSRGWSQRPNATGDYFGMPTRINSLGLRGEDFPVSKPAGEIRVLFVGDSITLGLGLPDEDTFVRRIEPLLANATGDRTVRTINAGCSGYTTWQETDYLEKEGLELSPNLIVLNFCLNDVLDVLNTEGKLVRGRPWILEYPPLNHVSGLARMAAYYSDRHRAKEIREQRLWTNENVFGGPPHEHVSFEALFEHSLAPRIVSAWNRIFDDLSDFDKACKEADVPWVLLSLPIRIKMPPDAGARRIIARLNGWAASKGVPHLDVTDAFVEWADGTKKPVETLFNDEVHPSPEGSRIISDELARFIISEELLKPAGNAQRNALAPP